MPLSFLAGLNRIWGSFGDLRREDENMQRYCGGAGLQEASNQTCSSHGDYHDCANSYEVKKGGETRQCVLKKDEDKCEAAEICVPQPAF